MPWTTYDEEKKYIAAMKELHLTHPRRPRGGQSGWEKRRDKSFQALCLKTFVAPFLPARLTAPGSPRMHLTVHFTRFRIGGKRRKQLAWAKTKIREVVRRGERVLSFSPSPGPTVLDEGYCGGGKRD